MDLPLDNGTLLQSRLQTIRLELLFSYLGTISNVRKKDLQIGVHNLFTAVTSLVSALGGISSSSSTMAAYSLRSLSLCSISEKNSTFSVYR